MPPSTVDLLEARAARGEISHMDILKMLGELRDEQALLGEAIMVLERLAQGGRRRRGRPPNWMRPGKVDPRKGSTRRFSAATRRKMAAAQKQRWARVRKGEVLKLGR